MNKTGGMPQEEVRGVDGRVGMATLIGGNADMATMTVDA